KAAPGLVADAVVSKLVDHLPLYRQERRYSPQGLAPSPAPLCGWVGGGAGVLDPLFRWVAARGGSAGGGPPRGTPGRVQASTREHCGTGRIWAYASAGGTVYDATEDRCRDGPAKFLAGFAGYLQCDAYAGYDDIFARSEGRIVEVACWAHVRRKFVEAE